MSYQRYKGREINPDVPVKVYKNLHNGKMSVQQDGFVVAHVDTITLRGVNFKVSESGRQRVLTERKKNVHAFVTGYVVYVNEPVLAATKRLNRRVNYNPYKCGEFTQTTNEGVLVRAWVAPYERLICSAELGLFITNGER